MENKNNCEHRKTRENFPFGKHSTSRKVCKHCGQVVTKKDLEKIRIKNGREKRKRR